MMKDAAYWIALAHLPKWGNTKINDLILKLFRENKISLEEFFQLNENNWRNDYQLDERQITDLNQARTELASNAFLAESLFSQGFEILPITSSEYSKTLIDNLKNKQSPTILYIKGNKKILNEDSIAIVGSRDASEISLKFTDNVAKLASTEFKVIISGIARGVSKQALDSAINYKVRSVIVLPQGIMTFGSGFKNYYRQIINGDVLVLSTFFPKLQWKTELAIAGNQIIYGLANKIYVAESSDKGETWSNVTDGLQKGRKIYIRKPSSHENNANNLLIKNGASPVDFNGNELKKESETKNENQPLLAEHTNKIESFENIIYNIIKENPITSKELLKKLCLNWTPQKMNSYLKKLDFIEIVKDKNAILYRLRKTNDVIETYLLF